MSPEFDVTKAWDRKTFKHPQLLAACRFSPCGGFVVAGDIEGRLLRWSLATDEGTELGRQDAWISGLAFAGSRLVSSDLKGGLQARDAATGTPAWSRAAHPGWLKALAASPDGTRVATGGRDGVVRVWSVSDGKLLREFSGPTDDVYSLAFHPDGRSLAAGHYAGKVVHWDLVEGRRVRELDAGVLLTRNPDFLCAVGGVRSLAFDARGERLACGGLREAKSNTFCPGLPTVLVMDWASGKLGVQARTKDDKVDGPVTALRFLPDGTLAGTAEGQSSGALLFWKPGEAEPFHVVGGQSLYDLDLAPDGLHLAAPAFESIGKGGNGRLDKRGEYVSNGGRLRVLALHEKPRPVKK
jgi:WD40 repeat protein